MSISNANASSLMQRGHTRPSYPHSNAPVQPVFSRSQAASAAARGEQVRLVSSPEEALLGNVAHWVCTNGKAHYNHLLKSPFHSNSNPSYFGTFKGADVFFNKDTGEVAIHNLNVKSDLRVLVEGVFNLDKETTNTCLVKPDGRILFDGEPVTKKHPQIREIYSALSKISNRMCSHDFEASKPSSVMVKPAWEPGSEHHADYVP